MLSLILPAYNEARRLPASLRRCADHFRALDVTAEIVVADDGSTDGTPRAVGEAALELADPRLVIRYLMLPHRGKGAAVRAGVLAASGDPIAFLDADLTIPVELVGELMNAIDRGADIAVASRYVPGSIVDRPWWRRVLGSGYRLCVRAIVPTGVSDTQCGGKAYTAEAARMLFGAQRLNGFAFDAELLFLARRMGLRVTEVPFTLHQREDTTIRLLPDAPRMLADLVRIRLNWALGRYGIRRYGWRPPA